MQILNFVTIQIHLVQKEKSPRGLKCMNAGKKLNTFTSWYQTGRVSKDLVLQMEIEVVGAIISVIRAVIGSPYCQLCLSYIFSIKQY